MSAQGRSHRGRPGGPWPPLSEPNKVQKIKFQTLGILLFTDVQKLYRPEIPHFLPCMLQFLGNLWRLFIFSYYIGEIDHFTLKLLKRSVT